MKNIGIILFLFFVVLETAAQDIHFSQYYAAPLNLNPAMTGYMGGNQRVVLNYRNQWGSITPSPFNTMAGSFDCAIGRDNMGGNWIGAGLMVMKDQAGVLDLARSKVVLSGAYVLKLGENNYISAGLQGAYNQRSIDYSKMLVDAQITPSGFNTSLPHYENVDLIKKNFMELNAGLIWGYRPSDFLDVYSGVAFMHANSPKDALVADESTIGMRSVLHSGATIILNDKLMLQPALIMQTQKGVGELILGGAVGRSLAPGKQDITRIAYAGVWYRNDDAVVPYVGVEIESWKVGLSYDINTSDLNAATQGRGGLELSLKWEIPKPSLRAYKAVPCPRF